MMQFWKRMVKIHRCTYYVPGTVLYLLTALQGGYYSCVHFIDQGTEALKLSLTVTQWWRWVPTQGATSAAGSWSPVSVLPMHASNQLLAHCIKTDEDKGNGEFRERGRIK